MSRYVRLKDAMEVHRQFAINGRLASNIMEKYDNLPSIEINEDCISRAELRRNLARPLENNIVNEMYWKGWHDCTVAVETRIADAPSVVPSTEQSSKVGEWIKEYKGNGWNDYWDYTCSNCGKKYERADSVLYHSSYCPNCGAKMGE